MATTKSFSGKELQELVEETESLKKIIVEEKAAVGEQLKDTGLGGDAKELLEATITEINNMLDQLETKIKDDFEAKLIDEQEAENKVKTAVKAAMGK